MIDVAVVNAYIDACAPGVGRETLAAIIKVESSRNPWAINDNTAGGPIRPSPASYAEAVLQAKSLLKQGHQLDLGWAQINSQHLPRLRLTVEQVLEPCRNIAVAGQILRENFAVARKRYGYTTTALLHAISAYHTGSLYAGERYVQKVIAAHGTVLPAGARVLRAKPGLAPTPSSTVLAFDGAPGTNTLLR